MANQTGSTGFRSKAARYGFGRALTSAILQRIEDLLGIHLWVIFSRPAYGDFTLSEELRRFEIRRLTEADCLRAATDPALALSAEFASAAFARGDAAIGAFDDGRLVAYLWRSIEAAPLFDDLWIRVDLQPQFYGYKTLVLPEYRGLRLFQVMRALFDPEYLERGIERGVSYVAMRNLPSIASVELDPGHERIGHAVIFAPDRFRGALLTGRARQRIRFERRRPANSTAPAAPA